ncbi:GntR family transcriptional regulator [Stella humosa]|uniref:GntR family transcriptional regulator n=1 Tax=Stella humosa TaxID=94 RepID=A0A3N1KXF7_9PROT|nr:GntR family transcriptional regulator [Stella humosa]ROP83459.1 GntR family transcriptional regulator [Stella humosa]BBK33269.1 GntR family transcriptional regulator [Stella humosa]
MTRSISPRATARNTAARAKPIPDGDSQSLTETAYRRLEELIVTLQLAPGSGVSEAELSRKLGIGRTPIREALQRLARERLVLILPRRGIVVSEINALTQLRLIETRRELERLLSRRAAKRATDAERTRFRSIAAGMAKAAEGEDDIAFMRLDQAFNGLVLEAARNEFAAGAMALMHGLSRRYWYNHYRQVADLPQSARLHGACAEAIAAGDEAAAAAASDRLMDYIESFTRATVDASL